uniref:Flocculation protein FLO11-like n=1 Tax=Hirondellea gigas TaxID=1518452 RepID=A0A6A7G085_9CRUS
MILLALFTFVVTASAQTFSFGIGLGGGNDATIPTFDSQRSSSVSSITRGNPFASFGFSSIARSRGEPSQTFEEFFSSSRIGTRTPSTTRVTSRSSSSSDNSLRRSRVSTPVPFSLAMPAPNPTITSRGAPPSATPARPQQTRRISAAHNPLRDATRRSSPGFTSSGAAAGFVRVTTDLSSRGRVQEEVIIPATRPPTTTEAAEVIDVRDNLVGQSVCARGTAGDACREHLAITAMACTTGFCQQCQQCGSMSPDSWPKCCREHFLCCRLLVRSCQVCDQPLLTPFCGAAFGRCN